MSKNEPQEKCEKEQKCVKTISDYEWDIQFESHGMKLIRFGDLGRKRPGVLLENSTHLDVLGLGADYDESFFANEGLAKLDAWLQTNRSSSGANRNHILPFLL